ncbi:MAG: XRE family transcriptional regulator [Pseudonocardia sp.]
MQPDTLPTPRPDESAGRRIAANRERQRELYGAPLAERVRRVVDVLRISQARLARTLGVSPAMLSQLVSGRRVKISDPVVLARFQLIDHRCAGLTETPHEAAVDKILAEVGRARWRWMGTEPRAVQAPARPVPAPRPPCPAEALRRVCTPGRLAAAAAVLGPGFPELADLLRQAAVRR